MLVLRGIVRRGKGKGKGGRRRKKKGGRRKEEKEEGQEERGMGWWRCWRLWAVRGRRRGGLGRGFFG